MSTTPQLLLSKKVGKDGKAQISVRLTISRTFRPCFKSEVFVNPDYFKPIKVTRNGKGVEMGIVPPKKGKLNFSEVKEATDAETKIKDFALRLSRVADALKNAKEDVSRESIEDALRLTSHIPTTDIDFAKIQVARARAAKGIPTNGKTFFDWFEDFIKDHGKSLSEGRIKRYRVVERLFGRYQGFIRATESERKDFTLDIDTMDKDLIEDFFDYIVNEKALSEEYPNIFEKLVIENPVQRNDRKQVIGERGAHVMETYEKVVRTFFKWLLEQRATTNYPFVGVKIETRKYGTPYYLTLDERNAIADADLSECYKAFKAQGYSLYPLETLETQRDIFIFQCCVGCRVGDLYTFKPTNVFGGFLTYIPDKTLRENLRNVRVPLNGRASSLVAKYQGKDKEGRLFPFISKDKYNECIKEIVMICGIDRVITKPNSITGEDEQHPIWEVASSHMARRTFIGNLYKQVKDPNIIGKMSGHVEGSKAFARYRDIDDDITKEAVNLIN